MKLWIGEEVEGIYSGLKTLFIGSPEITFKKIEDNIINEQDIEQLYFGAGCCSKINEDVLQECLDKLEGLIITVEIDINDFDKYSVCLLQQCYLIITFNHENIHGLQYFNNSKVQIKLQTLNSRIPYLSTVSLKDSLETNLSDLRGKVYKNDRVIE